LKLFETIGLVRSEWTWGSRGAVWALVVVFLIVVGVPAVLYLTRSGERDIAEVESGVAGPEVVTGTIHPAPAAQRQAAPRGQAQAPQVIYSPWAKFCGKGQDANAKQVCFTAKDARTEAAVPVIAAALIEPEGEPKKLFRITLPAPLQLQYGTRVIIDQDQPMTAPFFTCFSNGCMADYEATAEMVQKLKKGQTLTIQAINLAGLAISFPLPLTDFAKAHEGLPTDPKVF
jgi:invasion protein IalB